MTLTTTSPANTYEAMGSNYQLPEIGDKSFRIVLVYGNRILERFLGTGQDMLVEGYVKLRYQQLVNYTPIETQIFLEIKTEHK